ncbi:hypothetical protein BDW67DRAFT_169425 [Aspergillus spinulosporus]
MSFAPPPGPPPPSVPEGWTTQYDDNYKQWFFVNLATGRSQWEPPQPTSTSAPSTQVHTPVPASEQAQSNTHTDIPAPPPSYEESGPGNPSAVASAEATDKKTAHSLPSNNPYNGESASSPGTPGASGSGSGARKDTVDSDAELAARLQAEEDARAGSAAPGAAAGYYNSNDSPHSQSSTPLASAGDREKGKEKKKGFFSKLMSKAASASGSRPGFAPPHPHHQQPAAFGRPPPGSYGAPSPGPGYGGPGGYYPPQHGYGPPVGYGPQPGYGYPPHGFYGSGMQPQRRHGGGGMGMAGAAALGVGGGLIGGALLADAIDDDHDYGGDYGGGDFGGGDDFGGDF